MASEKEINALLKELGLTKAQMQGYWEECMEVNVKVRMLSNCGKSWEDLPLGIIRTLPALKQETLRKAAEQKAVEEEEYAAKEKEEAQKAYYRDHFEEIMAGKIDCGEYLTEEELRTLVYEYDEVDRTYGGNRRWSRGVTSIIRLCGRNFAIQWEEGLTESQENSFDCQPYEVEEHTYQKTITVTEWLKKD